jgi:hypothetical protein
MFRQSLHRHSKKEKLTMKSLADVRVVKASAAWYGVFYAAVPRGAHLKGMYFKEVLSC